MLIMGLEEDYIQALEFITTVDFTKSNDVSKGFETNIRYLGGLLSANDLVPNRTLVDKAIELMNAVLVPLFRSESGAPYTNMCLKTNKPVPTDIINLAEFGTYSLEFTRLSQISQDPTYSALSNDLIDQVIQEPTKIPGLFPTSWHINPFKPLNTSVINLGGGGDSFYEYLVKNSILLGDSANPDLMNTWTNSVRSMHDYLLSPTLEDPSIQFIPMVTENGVSYSSQELICFWPGNILLGLSQMPSTEETAIFYTFADTLLQSCYATWNDSATGISPESWYWTPQTDILKGPLGALLGLSKETDKTQSVTSQESHTLNERFQSNPFSPSDPSYILRPETIESLFYFYRVTGETKYQDMAWAIFESIRLYTETPSGFAQIGRVDLQSDTRQDFMESFFFAETLKYLYLIFADKNCISLNSYVFNTEAHPFKLTEQIQIQS
ncbi:glycoside hydrolase [Phycomyces blakesleeanus]